MRHLLIILTLACSFIVTANESSSFDLGIKAHSEQSFEEAANYFYKAIQEDSTNLSAYFNFGMSSIGNKSYGQAIWAFEKCLKSEPNDLKAKEKLVYCYEMLNSQREYKPLINGLSSIVYSFSSNSWAILAILFSVVTSGAIILWKLNKIRTANKVLVSIGFVGFVLCIASILLAKSTYEFKHELSQAIVVHSEITTYYNDESPSKITLAEGTRLSIISQKGDSLLQVIDDDQKSHLIKSNDVWLF